MSTSRRPASTKGAEAGHDYALETVPFPPEGADGFFFSTPALTQRLDLLHHLIQFSDLTLFVRAPGGAGKTTFLEELLAAAGERWQVCRVPAGAGLTPDGLIGEMVSGFGLPARGDTPDAALQTLEAHLEALHRSHQVALIVADDAHELEPETYRFLMTLVARWEGFKARVVMLEKAPPGNTARGSVDHAEEFVHSIDLPPLTEEETGDYIHVRLTRAGLVGDSPFSREIIRGIHSASGGNPAKINQLAAQVLANQSASSQRGNKVHDHRTRGAVLILLLAIAGLVTYRWLLSPSGDSWSEGRQTALAVASRSAANTIPGRQTGARTEAPRAPDTKPGDGVVPERVSAAGDSILEQGSNAAGGEQIPALEEQLPGPGLALTTIGNGALDADVALDVAEEDPATTGVGSNDGTTSVPAAPELGPAGDRGPVPVRAAAGDEPSSVSAHLQITPRLPAIDAPKDLRSPDAGVTEDARRSAAARPEDPIAVEAPTPTPPASVPGLSDISWLRSQPTTHYTIQLMGSHDPAAIQRFANIHGLGPGAAWFTTRHEDRPWFVVVHGSYPNMDQARRAILTLPYGLRRGAPWPRSIASILGAVADTPSPGR